MSVGYSGGNNQPAFKHTMSAGDWEIMYNSFCPDLDIYWFPEALIVAKRTATQAHNFTAWKRTDTLNYRRNSYF